MGLGEWAEERGEVLGFEEGFVALDVDVDVCVDLLRDGVDAVGAARKIRGGGLDGPVILVTKIGHFVGVGCDDDAVELGAGGCGFVNPGEHWAPGDDAKDFAGEARGGEARGDDTENGVGLLFCAAGIKYDGNWLCRGDRLSSKSILCRRNPFIHIGGVAQMVRATDS